jgi:hypothetical protein
VKPGPRVFSDSFGWGYVVTSSDGSVERIYVLREDEQSLGERGSEPPERVEEPRVRHGGLSLRTVRAEHADIKSGRVSVRHVLDQLANLVLSAHARTFPRFLPRVKRGER